MSVLPWPGLLVPLGLQLRNFADDGTAGALSLLKGWARGDARLMEEVLCRL